MAIVVINHHPVLDVLTEKALVLKADKKPFARAHAVRLGILNLMPNKIQTETQFYQLFQELEDLIEPVWLKQTSRKSHHTHQGHLEAFYQTFDEAYADGLDALIITGAPVEHLPFGAVDYWQELTRIFDVVKANKMPCYFICWAAQAALYHYHGIDKNLLANKIFGVYQHTRVHDDPILDQIEEEVWAPHSRYTTWCDEHIANHEDLKPLLHNPQTGWHLVREKNAPLYFCSGHMEYDLYGLDREYQRDLEKHLDIGVPFQYYKNITHTKTIVGQWLTHSRLLTTNWIQNIKRGNS